ncbi:type II toxin-antitoxin system RatA family toxin [Streptomyces sp. NPDC059917]|uniref:type II toxin-antitoxin system RatA family toxin n=1 Tax=Streptomyces sp. NPDC059917 TaxID=3347002 RepID=UPI003669525E
MPRVFIEALLPDVTPRDAFARVTDFTQYPQHAPHVRAVEVEQSLLPHTLASHWEVDFRNGTLTWSEQDELDHDGMTARFTQLQGDFDTFTGGWRVLPAAAGARVQFSAEFDFGVASLAPLLDPLAQRTLEDNVQTIMESLFAGARILCKPSHP